MTTNFLQSTDAQEWNPESAYLLGLLFADGHSPKGERKPVTLTTIDRQLANLVCSLVKAKQHWHPPKGIGKKEVCRCIINVESSETFRAMGLPVGNKIGKLEWPPLLPHRFARDFIRGFFDGDGWTARNVCTIGFASKSLPLLLAIEYIGQGLYCAPQEIREYQACYRLCYADIVDVAKWGMYLYLYPTTDICLLRKRKRLFDNLGASQIPDTSDLRYGIGEAIPLAMHTHVLDSQPC